MLKKSIFSLILLFSSPNLWAECTPDTVQFYLEKGFSQEQITKLCSHVASDAPSYQPYQKPVVIVQEGYAPENSVEERSAINELKGGIDGRSIDVTDTHINFIRKVCIRAGNAPERDQRVEKCIDSAYSIARDGLQVMESGSRLLLFGQQQVEIISSDIQRKFLVADPWGGYSADIRYLLQRKYESQEEGHNTVLPLRKSASLSQIVHSIRTIAASYELKKTGSHDSEVAKVLDDSYVPPSEEEYLASNPTYEDIEEEKKKNKKWWNLFD